MTLTVSDLRAREILDSRGRPTLSVTARLNDGSQATAHVPAGASTGRHEALELRDGDPARYRGRGVLRAAANVHEVILPALRGREAEDQTGLDRALIALDGTPTKSRLGANALLGVSCAVARAVSVARRLPLWRALATGQQPRLPVPMVNILSGGLHGGGRLEVQDFLVIPRAMPSLAPALERIVAIHEAAGEALAQRGYLLTGVADEGGWAPSLPTNEDALKILTGVLDQLGLRHSFSLAVDVAATHFFENDRYLLASESRALTAAEMIDTLAGWCGRYPISSLEDGLAEDDWPHWTELTSRLGATVQLLGDDLFTTNPVRLREGIATGAANAVLVKMNQIGTLTETFEVIRIARSAGYRCTVSARSGETEDSFLADLAVACGADQIKIGSITRSERLAKYNRLLEIESELDASKPRPL